MSSIKAFELSSVIERITLGEKIRIQIECIDFCGKRLYVGTSDSFVIEFNCENGRITAQQTQYKYLGLKKPIITIKAVFILERILCICDSNLLILNQDDLEPVSYGNKLKNVSALCLNENPSAGNPFSVEICIARKKQLLICDFTSEKVIPLKEISIAKPALALAMDGQFICVGTDSNFYIVNWENSQILDLCSCDSEILLPISKRITKEEFLISGPGSLGLFVKVTGISEKPPLQWGTDLLSIAYSHPYLLCLSDASLSVFSVVDQQLKQRIPFTGGTCLENCDGTILIASNDSVYSLVSVAWEKQIQMLLSNKKVKEALELSQNWHQTGVSEENFNKFTKQIKQKAGFIEFSQRNFSDSRKHFIEGNLDIRELLCLYPDFSPMINNFRSTLKHEIPDVIELTEDDSDALLAYKLFLFDYLEELKITNNEQYQNFHNEINTSLMILCSQMDSFSSRLLELITVNSNSNSELIIKHLLNNHRYHALALLYSLSPNNYDKAIDVWQRIETKEYSDNSYPGLECIAKLMTKIHDNRILMDNIDFILERDQNLGSWIIINSELSANLDCDTIITHFQRYPEAEQKYLEYLVYDCKLKKEKYHTHLAMIYVESVIKLMRTEAPYSELNESKERLRHLLRTSSLYRVQLILGKVIDAKLYHECAILYGKLGEHEKALNILVQDVQDYGLAEQYCIDVSSKETEAKLRYRIFHVLLEIYLELSQKNFPDLIVPALQLLNSEVTEFDTTKVLELIPQKWPIKIIEQFINKSIRRSMHRLRQSMIAKGLVTQENRVIKYEKLDTERKCIFLNEDRLCSICHSNIIEAEFIWYPTLDIVLHPYCGKGLTKNLNF